jgi:hypothetical protein
MGRRFPEMPSKCCRFIEQVGQVFPLLIDLLRGVPCPDFQLDGAVSLFPEL